MTRVATRCLRCHVEPLARDESFGLFPRVNERTEP